jgi:hypothetical protein
MVSKLFDAHLVLGALLLPSQQGCRSGTSGISGTSWVDSFDSRGYRALENR